MRVLVTYFAPFGTDQENASALAAKLLPNTIGAAQVITQELPVAFEGAEQALKQALCELSPDLVLCTGQAEGTAELHLERVAVNLRDARMPDNEGFAPKEMSICPEGPTAYTAEIRHPGCGIQFCRNLCVQRCDVYSAPRPFSKYRRRSGRFYPRSTGTTAGGGAYRQRTFYGVR